MVVPLIARAGKLVPLMPPIARAGRLVPERAGIVEPRLAAVGRLVPLLFTFSPPLPAIVIQSVGFSSAFVAPTDLAVLDGSVFAGIVVELHLAG